MKSEIEKLNDLVERQREENAALRKEVERLAEERDVAMNSKPGMIAWDRMFQHYKGEAGQAKHDLTHADQIICDLEEMLLLANVSAGRLIESVKEKLSNIVSLRKRISSLELLVDGLDRDKTFGLEQIAALKKAGDALEETGEYWEEDGESIEWVTKKRNWRKACGKGE